MSKVDILRIHSIFGKIPGRMIERLAPHVRTRNVRRGATIFAKDDAGTALVGVLSGRVQISVPAADGRKTVLNVIHEGEVFGEIALLDGRPRTADAIAISDCKLMMIERRDFVPFLHEYPEVGLALIEILCGRLRRTTQQIDDLVYLNLPARLAKVLLRLASEVEGASPYKISITQQEIGQMVGASRESINKHLRSWAQANWVVLKRGKIVVLQPDALADIARNGLELAFA